MQTNLTKAKLKAGETVLGFFVRYPEAGLVEMLSYQPWDFAVFDGEHGTLEPRDCEHMVRAAESAGIVPIIRLPYPEPMLVPPPGEGGDGNSVNKPRRTPVRKEAVA